MIPVKNFQSRICCPHLERSAEDWWRVLLHGTPSEEQNPPIRNIWPPNSDQLWGQVSICSRYSVISFLIYQINENTETHKTVQRHTSLRTSPHFLVKSVCTSCESTLYPQSVLNKTFANHNKAAQEFRKRDKWAGNMRGKEKETY